MLNQWILMLSKTFVLFLCIGFLQGCTSLGYHYNDEKKCDEYTPLCLGGYQERCTINEKGCKRCSCEPVNYQDSQSK